MRRTTLFRRGSQSILFFAALGTAVLGLSSTAQASTTYSDSDVAITGGIGLNQCINQSVGGAHVNQNNSCVQVGSAGNVFVVDNVNLTVYQGGRSDRPIALSGVTAEIRGYDVDSFDECMTTGSWIGTDRHSREDNHRDNHRKGHKKHRTDHRNECSCGHDDDGLFFNGVEISILR